MSSFWFVSGPAIRHQNWAPEPLILPTTSVVPAMSIVRPARILIWLAAGVQIDCKAPISRVLVVVVTSRRVTEIIIL